MSNHKNEQLNTPVGVAVYPRLNEPDYKFDPAGIFSVTLRVPAEAGQELKNTLDAKLDEWHIDQMKTRRKPNLKRAPLTVKAAIDEDGNETGEWDFKFSMKHDVTTQTGKNWVQRPKLYDGQGKGFVGPVIGGGSKLVINFVPAPYFTPTMGCGLKLRLNAVQVVELVEYKKASAESLGFDNHTGGYVAPEEAVAANAAPVIASKNNDAVAPMAAVAEDEL
jgi:hypothetical protein